MAERNIMAAVDAAAERLGNSRPVVRSSCVHRRIPEAYADGELLPRWKRARRSADFDRAERLVLALLDEKAEAGSRRSIIGVTTMSIGANNWA